jgi:hypothetical protein
MRPVKPSIPALLLLSVLFIQANCKFPVKQDSSPEVVAGKYPTTFRENEIVVIYKNAPTPAQQAEIRNAITAQGKTVSNIQQCNSCGGYVELWTGSGIHSVIRTEGVSGGSGGTGSKGVGEDSIARYSLNFVSNTPLEVTRSLDSIAQYPQQDKPAILDGTNKDTIVIAVLDTGIETLRFLDRRYVWTNNEEARGGDDGNCYTDDVHGWNFIGENANAADDSRSMHGTIVSSYIVDEFLEASRRGTNKNFVQIMPLKTHDANGSGDLFSSICAIHYAIDKKVDIINASWGFYYYEGRPHPYMDSLITKILRQEGILFITAAGNKNAAEDVRARSALGSSRTDAELRNLTINRFYPATLSEEGNNVLTVTTTDSVIVSPTQNHSAFFVDLGIRADSFNTSQMLFAVPFTNPTRYISGSSFATGIATGKIASYLPKSSYTSGVNKIAVFSNLDQQIRDGAIPPILSQSNVLSSAALVRNGRMSRRR